MQGFEKEWKWRLPLLQGKRLISIYFGGGTPSLLGPERIHTILNWIEPHFKWGSTIPEITLEANPEELTLAMMQGYAQAGVNRVSVGLQALNDPLLKTLGRLHNSNKAVESVHLISESGVKNITVDLMYDLPGQTLHQWQATLDAVVRLPINHLSLYNLTIEPHTGFYKRQEQLKPQLPTEETSRQMYLDAVKTLEQAGLKQYEISAFAKGDHQSRHNIGYWTGRPFLGFGPSAFSFWNGMRFRNVSNLRRYCEALGEIKSPVDFEEQLDPAASQRELLAIGLRLLNGVDLAEFEGKYGILDTDTKAVTERLCSQGLLQRNGARLSMTRDGVLFYDTIATEIV